MLVLKLESIDQQITGVEPQPGVSKTGVPDLNIENIIVNAKVSHPGIGAGVAAWCTGYNV